jgi:light-regulated signal transduction histidine kinase (bacteriophytochrome)
VPDSDRPGAAADRLAAVEQELQEFSYIVSHDLAASFRHAAEFSRLLEDEPDEGLSDRQRTHIAHIRAAAEKCQTMMEQLRVFSRLKGGALDTAQKETTPTVRLALLRLSAEVEEAGAEVRIEPLGEASVDSEMLALAAHHLLGNAIKFRRPEVRARISVASVQDELFWRLRITDNGIGVDPAHREKAFRMFHRLNAEGAFPGIGAGLAIVRRIARWHGGEARFIDGGSGVDGGGACIELALPNVGYPPLAHQSPDLRS